MVLVGAGGVMAIEMWRARNIQQDDVATKASVPAKAVMTIDEAAAMLGVDDKALPEDIRTAHRKLISQIHPDKGGTDYLAAKINEARDVMLKAADRETS